ncbi:MAG: 4-(cytidine 5'-diphospho)-2-C-methyl-D-erythritol kinase [Alphaproteobacteria bacterium]|nr:4-(cytidine 5'-diphospho)-2-C-methyl-D-erythritol kinase [Alphaproteobacteria bacterium]
MAFTAFAPAKVNLYLHVIGRRPYGYHLLDSLIAFADIGDRITAEPAATLSLEIGGLEAAGLVDLGQNNLVLRAARLLADHTGTARGAALYLEKNLPVAAGIGGGSSDAAAALRLLAALWQVTIGEEELRGLGAGLGADLPACLYGRAAWVSGIGERIEPAPDLPEVGILLANPRKNLPTGAVFGARSGPFREAGRFAPMPKTAIGLARMLMSRGNDLTGAAIGLVPEISTVLARLSRLPGVLIARMSGSGATCFALFSNRGAAEDARTALVVAEPDWWCAAGGLIAGKGLCG